MAYGNASKKTVPQSALSKNDLEYIAGHINTAYGEYIAGHINTAYGEKISQLEEDVKNLEDSSGGGEVVKNIFFVHFWKTGPQLSCDKTNEEIVEAIHSGCKIFAMYTNNSDSDTVNAQEMISYQTAKGYIDVGSGMAVEMEWVIFKFFYGSDYLKLEYDPKYSTWRESIEHGVFIVPITLNEDGTVTSEISGNDVVEAINSGKIVAADITYKSATIRVYDVVRGDYGVLFSFQAESEIVSVYSDGEYWKSVVDVVADKKYVDDAIQSAIYDSWGDAV